MSCYSTIFTLLLLTGLPRSSGRWRPYSSCYLGECVNDAAAGENNMFIRSTVGNDDDLCNSVLYSAVLSATWLFKCQGAKVH